MKNAAQSLQDALDDLFDLGADIQDVSDKQNALDQAKEDRNDACPTPVADCAAAQMEVDNKRDDRDAALVALGWDTVQDIPEFLQALLNATQEAYDVALAARDVALAARDAALVARNAALAAHDLALADLQPTWQDRRCHRSAFSGQAQAALRLEREDPRTSVTFVHLACSGATIPVGLLGFYEGAEGGPRNIPPQIDRAKQLVGDREIDALLVSIGGNDANFAPIIETCILEEPCFNPGVVDLQIDNAIDGICGPLGKLLDLLPYPLAHPTSRCLGFFDGLRPGNAQMLLDDGIDRLPDRYIQLENRLSVQHPDFQQGRVYITDYPDPTKNENEEYCGFDPMATLEEQLKNIPGFTQPEMEWADFEVLPRLNGVIQDATKLYDWNLVEEGLQQFSRHGYCAAQHWVVRLQETFRIQANVSGAVHPTKAGHQVYAGLIASELLGDFYSPINLTIDLASYQLVAKERVNVTEYRLFFRAEVENESETFGRGVTARATSTSPDILVLDDSLTFGDVPGLTAVQSRDTFSIQLDRRVHFDTSALTWEVSDGDSMGAPRPPQSQ